VVKKWVRLFLMSRPDDVSLESFLHYGLYFVGLTPNLLTQDRKSSKSVLGSWITELELNI
jgi:hypothetical protein